MFSFYFKVLWNDMEKTEEIKKIGWVVSLGFFY